MKTCVNVLLLIIVCCLKSPGQQSTDMAAPHPKKFISQIEIFAGPSLIIPYGNSDLKNYGMASIGYAGGLGFTHMISRKIELSFKVLWEKKGSKVKDDVLLPPDAFCPCLTGVDRF